MTDAADDNEHKHRGPFVTACKTLGLKGPWTATTASGPLKHRLSELAQELGAYPHKRLRIEAIAKQTTRQLKVECTACGCICRMSRKAIDDCGTPTCACGTKMEEAK